MEASPLHACQEGVYLAKEACIYWVLRERSLVLLYTERMGGVQTFGGPLGVQLLLRVRSCICML